MTHEVWENFHYQSITKMSINITILENLRTKELYKRTKDNNTLTKALLYAEHKKNWLWSTKWICINTKLFALIRKFGYYNKNFWIWNNGKFIKEANATTYGIWAPLSFPGANCFTRGDKSFWKIVEYIYILTLVGMK